MICGILLIISEIGKPVSRTQSLIFAHWGDNVVIANLVQTQLRLSPNRSRTFQLASTYLRRTLNLSSFYLPSTLPLFCIYQKTKKSTFSTIINFELSIVNSKSSELWIVILRWTFPLATFLLSPCYPLATPLLSAYLDVSWIYLESTFLLSAFFLPSFYLLPTHHFVFTKRTNQLQIILYWSWDFNFKFSSFKIASIYASRTFPLPWK